ncbi:hypothetical protein ACIRS1_20575 [Kitasatospora sp. NPDC101176]|uniref:hypothetical protein n=1 Tax=Kitasatospora sp. NPDC101176 TaxID=3364099 RepID=UPI0038063F99
MTRMGELDELRARLAALEAEVGRLREESAVARSAAEPAPAKPAPVQPPRATTPAATPAPTRRRRTTAGPRAEQDPPAVDGLAGEPEAVLTGRVEPGHSMTSLADVLGIMVSDRAERTGVLRAPVPALEARTRDTGAREARTLVTRAPEARTLVTRAPEARAGETGPREARTGETGPREARTLEARTAAARNTPLPRHGEFLEGLLAGRPPLSPGPAPEGP